MPHPFSPLHILLCRPPFTFCFVGLLVGLSTLLWSLAENANAADDHMSGSILAALSTLQSVPRALPSHGAVPQHRVDRAQHQRQYLFEILKGQPQIAVRPPTRVGNAEPQLELSRPTVLNARAMGILSAEWAAAGGHGNGVWPDPTKSTVKHVYIPADHDQPMVFNVRQNNSPHNGTTGCVALAYVDCGTRCRLRGRTQRFIRAKRRQPNI